MQANRGSDGPGGVQDGRQPNSNVPDVMPDGKQSLARSNGQPGDESPNQGTASQNGEQGKTLGEGQAHEQGEQPDHRGDGNTLRTSSLGQGELQQVRDAMARINGNQGKNTFSHSRQQQARPGDGSDWHYR